MRRLGAHMLQCAMVLLGVAGLVWVPSLVGASAANVTPAESSIATPPHVPGTPQPLVFVVLYSHCVVVDLGTIFLKGNGYAAGVIFDSVAQRGELRVGDAAGVVHPKPRPRVPYGTVLHAGQSLDPDEAIVTYCPAGPASSLTEQNDTVKVRFLPIPVTTENAVEPYDLVFTAVPLTYEPASPRLTLEFDWRGRKGEREKTPFEIQPPTVVDDMSTTFLFVPRDRLKRHWQPLSDGHLFWYTPQTALSPAGEPPSGPVLPSRDGNRPRTLDDVEVFLLPDADTSMCELYLDEEELRPVDQADDDDGDDEGGLRVVDHFPFSFNGTMHLHVRIKTAKKEEEEEVQSALQEFWANANNSDSAEVDDGVVCSFGFRGREDSSDVHTADGILRVVWRPFQRFAVSVNNATLQYISILSAETNASDSAALQQKICVARSPYCGQLYVSAENREVRVSTYPHCSSTNFFGVLWVQRGGQECDPHRVNPPSELEQRFGREALGWGGNGTDGAQRMRVVDAIDFYTVATHTAFTGEVHSPHVFAFLKAASEAADEEPRSGSGTVDFGVNTTTYEPIVVDVLAHVPEEYRRRIKKAAVRTQKAHCLRGTLYKRVRSLGDARRGAQWHTCIAPSPAPRHWYADEELPSSRRRRPHWIEWRDWSVLNETPPLLLRYAPQRDWLAPVGAASGGVNDCGAADEFSVHLVFFPSHSFRLDVRFAAPLSAPPTAPPAARQQDSVVRFHVVVYEHTPNLVALPLPLDIDQQPTALTLSSVPAHGALHATPLCDSPDKAGQWLLGHCEKMTPTSHRRWSERADRSVHHPLDVNAGCVCCMHNCSAYVGEHLGTGSKVRSYSKSQRETETTPFTLFYNPSSTPPSPNRQRAADGRAVSVADDHLAANGKTTVERVAVVQYRVSRRQLCELVMHVRRWPDTTVSPALLFPAAADTTDGGSPPPSYVLRMSSRVDVETALIGISSESSEFNASAAPLPFRVYECVAVPRRAAQPAPRRWRRELPLLPDVGQAPSFVASEKLVPVSERHGVTGHWPKVTQGCLVLGLVAGHREFPLPFPSLQVHSVLAGGPPPSAGSGAAALTAAALLRIQPYIAAPKRVFFSSVYLVPPDSSTGIRYLHLSDKSFKARIKWSPLWSSASSPPSFSFRLSVPWSSDDDAGISVVVADIPQRGCLTSHEITKCLHTGQSFQLQLVDPHERGASIEFTYAMFDTHLKRVRAFKHVYLVDTVKLVTLGADGESPLGSYTVTVEVETVPLVVVVGAVLVVLSVVAVVTAGVRERRRMLSHARAWCSRAWMIVSTCVSGGVVSVAPSYEMVARERDELGTKVDFA